MTLYSGPTDADLTHIPAALQALPQWVLWRGEDRVNEQTGEVIGLNKIPIDPQTLRNADTTDPRTWGTYQQCAQALPVALEGWEHDDSDTSRGGGLGFVFTADDPFCGIDLDKCRNPDTGELELWAQEHVKSLSSYTEVTPSSTGLHILVQGNLPPHGRKKGRMEMYDQMRFFTMTGWHLPGTPLEVEPRQAALNALHLRIFGSKKATPPPSYAPGALPLMDDGTLLTRATRAKNGAKFSALWAGDSSGYGSQSEADLALCSLLAFWSRGHAEQIDRLFRQSGLMREKWDEQRGELTYGERTVQEALARQSEYYTPGGKERTRLQPVLQPGILPYGDTYNARRLVERYGTELRYCGPWHKWLAWSDTHWQTDDTGGLMRRAKETIWGLMDLVKDLPAIVEQQMLLAHIKASLATPKLKAMIENAQSELPLPVLPDALDSDPWLLNVANGTLDLRTGTLKPHDRGDLLTRCIPVKYDKQAPCPTWDKFLWRIMGGTDRSKDSADDSALALEARDKADARATRLIAFLQRAVGYALTGVVREHVLPILWGKGRNGKSTFLNTLLALLGTYALKAPAELLMLGLSDRHPTERADLFQKRFVAVIETEQGRRLAEVFVKEATGGDPISARRMREDFWTFLPTHKLFLATNYKPDIKGTDDAIWERMKLVEFTVTIPKKERDTTLPDKLLAELPGILAWAVRGCMDWQKNGIGEPEDVTTATDGYRAEMDVLREFFDECCLTGSTEYRAKSSELYAAYQRWSGESTTTQKAWGTALAERGYERFTNNGVWYRGITLREPPKKKDASLKKSEDRKPA